MGKIISLIISGIYLIDGYVNGSDRASLFQVGVYFIFALACIWFGDELGDYVGPVSSPRGIAFVDQKSPGSLVRFMGWVFLLLPILLIPLFYAIKAK